MDIHYLNYIIAIAEEKNMTRAAQRLYVSQSSLSHYLAKLEQELGTALFFRGKNELIPTPAGEMYLDAARRVVEIQQTLYKNIRSLDKRGHLRISTTSQWGLEMITSITSRFKEAFPEVTFELFQANADNLKKMLETEAIDFALMSVGSREELTENYELLQEEELFFAVPASHPYCRQNPGAELSEEELIRSFSCTHLLLSKKGTANRTLADKIFSRYPHGLSSVSEVNGMTMTRELVAQGVGAAFIPTSCRQEEARIHYYALRPRLVRYNVLVHRKNLVLNQPEQFFHSCVVNYYS